MTSTAEWEEKLANPDPRVKWALDVMDREGQDFEGFLGKIWTPLAAMSLPLAMTFARNSSSRLPLRTNMVATLMTLPFFGVFGHYTRYERREEGVEQEKLILKLNVGSGWTPRRWRRRPS